MKVLIYHSSLKKGGAERVLINLANYFVKKNHIVQFVIIDNTAPEYILDKRVSVVHLTGLKNTGNIVEALRYNFSLVEQLKRELRKYKPDVLLCFGVNQLLHAYLARGIHRKFKIIGSERANPYEDPCGRMWNFFKIYLYSKVDGFIFQTIEAKQFYDRKNKGKGVVIENPIAAEFVCGKKIHIKDREDNVFCSVGRLTPAKSYDYLINTFAKFHTKYENTKLIIYGDGKERSKLEAIIKQLNAQDYIFLPGVLDNVESTISKCRFFILSSKREGMPNTLLEAMASGCVCIATRCKFGPEHIISDNINGVLVGVNDEKGMLAALEKVYLNHDLQEKLSENAYGIRKTHSIESIAEQYLSYLREVLQ